MDFDVVSTALAWLESGHQVTLGTVVKTWGSSPRPPGSLMIIRDDGQVAGSLSGGCIEDDLIDRLRRGELDVQTPSLTVYGANAEEAQRFGLPCGGTVQIVLEPLAGRAWLQELLVGLKSGRSIERRLDIETGQVLISESSERERLTFDGRQLNIVHGPSYRLLLIGAGQLSRYVASMALMLDYRVIICDPRPEYHEGWANTGNATLSTLMPDDQVHEMKVDAHCAVLALTHDPKLDDMALMEVLKTPAFYIGALGSRRSNETRRARLLELDVTAEEIARLRGPVGLPLGGSTPPEIAVSIVAEMTAVRHGVHASAALAATARQSG
jgi:xanthine dehydrogenase accessory factor